MADDLFTAQEAAEKARKAIEAQERQEQFQRDCWRGFWGWDGPTVGGLCDVNTPIVETAEGDRLYCYMEQCRLIEQRADGRWLAEIEMGEVHGKPWWKDGRRVLLGVCDIWPPVRVLRAEREARRVAA